MAFTNIYSKSGYLKMVHTGNTMGMSGATFDATVHALVTLNPSLNNGSGVTSSTAPTTFAGTTNTYSQDGSWANLNPSPSDVPPGSTVDFAILIWCASTAVNDAATLTLGLPDGTNRSVTSNPTYAYATGNAITRATVVTSLLQGLPNTGFGNYSLSGLPALVPCYGVGWSLVIIYSNPSMVFRNINLFIGTLSSSETTTVSGFFTPISGTVTARAYIMAGLGDSSLVGDQFTLNGVALSGPRNPSTNFFCSQVCDYLGNIALISSFGDRNCTPGTAPVYQRAQYDVTNVNASGVLGNSLRSTVVGIPTTGDAIVANAMGLEINANSAIININKTVDKGIALPGDTLTYTIVYKNTGASSSLNTMLFDTIPKDTTFVPNSVTINGVTQTGANPQTGVNLGSILPTNGVVTVTFKVVVSTTGVTNFETIPNVASSTFSFVYDPLLPNVSGSALSNTAITTLNFPPIISTKQVDKTIAGPNEIITYTIALKAIVDTVNSIVFLDTIPSGMNFIPNSLTINGASNPGNPNPPTGVSIGTMVPGSVTTITYQVSSITIPVPNPVVNNSTTTYTPITGIGSTQSNAVSTTINGASLISSKVVNKTFANVGDILTYTIPIKNQGTTTASTIVFLDTVPSGTTLIANSLKQDGVVVSGSPNPPGVTLPNPIKSLGTSTITFQVVITTIPIPNPIQNSATSNYGYIIDSTTTPNKLGSSQTTTNIVNTQVNNANLSGSTKSSDRSFADCGDIITYTILIPNTGSTTAQNVVFKDTIPTGTVLIPNSVVVNGVPQPGASPSTGVTIGNIDAGATTSIQFQVQVQC